MKSKTLTKNPETRWLTENIFAHRGFHDKPAIPENSLSAFRRAVGRGFGAEFDVHLLSDGTLAVFHDSDLFRCTGVNGKIESLDYSEMKKLRLEGTEERIPTLSEVLDIFENSEGKNGEPCPIIIELKPVNNTTALVHAVCDMLDSYRGHYCIECFDPRALTELKKYRPDILRGQLSQNFLSHKEGLPFYQRLLLTNLFLNYKTQPDFIAYRFEDRKNHALRRAVKKGAIEVCWTIRSKTDFDTAKALRCVPIFEGFDPEEC